MNTTGYPAGTRNNPAFAGYHFIWQALDWFYPPVCGGCKQPGSRWCPACQDQVSVIGQECCPMCGQPGRKGLLCPACRKTPPPYQALRSWGIYQGALREAIHTLKYDKDIGIAEVLSFHLIDLYYQEGWNVDLITGVPLNRSRILERGYNQAGLLALPLAYCVRKEYRSGMITRIRETQPQVGLNAVQRKHNVLGAFQANPKMARGKKVLVIDDVTTTGSTIEACTRALLDAGAVEVYGLTLARAAHPQADPQDQSTGTV